MAMELGRRGARTGWSARAAAMAAADGVDRTRGRRRRQARVRVGVDLGYFAGEGEYFAGILCMNSQKFHSHAEIARQGSRLTRVPLSRHTI